MPQNPHPPNQRYPQSMSRGYPYNAQTHTYLSPGGMNHPAPTPHRSVSDPNNHPPRPIPALHSMSSPASPWLSGPLHSQPERSHLIDRYQLGQSHDIPPHLPVAHATSYSPNPPIIPHPASFPNPPLRPLSTADLPETSRSASPSGSASSAPVWRAGGFQGVRAHDDRADGVNMRKSFSKGRKGRIGGPPKAKLGGPGGKTFDEMLAAGEVQQRRISPSPSPIAPAPQALKALKEGMSPGDKEEVAKLLRRENPSPESTLSEPGHNNGPDIANKPELPLDTSGLSKSPKLPKSEPIDEQHSVQKSDPSEESPHITMATANIGGGTNTQPPDATVPPHVPDSESSQIPSLSADETDNPWDAPLEGSLAGFEQLMSAERAAYHSHGLKPPESSGQDLLVSPGLARVRQTKAGKRQTQADASSMSTGQHADGRVRPIGSHPTTRPKGLGTLPPRAESPPPIHTSLSGNHSPKRTKRSRDEQPSRGDVSSLSPPEDGQGAGVPGPRTTREPGAVNNTFLRKTLASMLRENKETEERRATRRPRHSNPSVSSLVSESATAPDEPISGHDRESKQNSADGPISVQADAGVSAFSSSENSTLLTPTRLEDDEVLPRGTPQTITPAKSKRISLSLQRRHQTREKPLPERGPHAGATMDDLFMAPIQELSTRSEGNLLIPNKGTDESTSLSLPDARAPMVSDTSDGLEDPATVTPEGEVAKQGYERFSVPHTTQCRPATPDLEVTKSVNHSQVSSIVPVDEAATLVKRPESAASFKAQLTKLRPDAGAFVPPADLQPSRSLVDASTDTLDEDVDGRVQKKRGKLRPSAAAFVPRPASTRRHLLPPHVAPAAPAPPGIVPDTFAFAPVLPNLLPAGQGFTPHFPQPFLFGQNGPGPGRSTPAFINRPTHMPAGVPGYVPPSQILLGQARHPQVPRPPIGHPADFVPGPRAVSAMATLHALNSRHTPPSFSGDLPFRPMADVSLAGVLESAQRRFREVRIPDDILRNMMPSTARPTTFEASGSTVATPASVLVDPTTIKPLTLGDPDRDIQPLPSDMPSAGPHSRASESGQRTFTYTIDDTELGSEMVAQTPAPLSSSVPAETSHSLETHPADNIFTSTEDSPSSGRRHTPRLSPIRFPKGVHLRVGSLTSPQLIPQSPSPMLLDEELTARPEQPAATVAGTEIKIDPAADDRRSREWVYPAGGDHRSRPSISRRHTMPTEFSSLGEPPAAGIASTFSTRVHGLREILARGSMGGGNGESSLEDTMSRRKVSTQSSAEFPLRRERKALTVVNSTPEGDESPGGIPAFESPAPMDMDARMDIVLQTLRRIELGEQDRRPVASSVATIDGSAMEKIEGTLEQTRQTISTLSDETKELASTLRTATAHEDLTRHLEKQSSLLESLVNAFASPHLPQELPADLLKRIEEMFEAVGAGQSSIMEQIAKSFGTHQVSRFSELEDLLGGLRASQDETAGVIHSIRAAQPQVAELRQQLVEANDALRTTKVEYGHATTRLSALEDEHRQVRGEKVDVEEKLKKLETKQAELREQMDKLVSGQTAAERERDALSDALRARMADTERLNEELERARAELLSHKEKAAAHEGTAKSLEVISAANTAFHEELLSRMARLDEGVHESMGSRVKEYEAVLDRNKVLQSEVDGLRAKLESALADVLSIKTEREKEVSGHKISVANLEARLASEVKAREESERRGQNLEKELEKARGERENALLVANERASWARMTDVRIQAMAQECVYWRQFALESDRKKYRAYMASSPFRGPEGTASGQGENEGRAAGGSRQSSASPPDAQIRTPKQTPDSPEKKARVETASPSHTAGIAHPLMASTSSIVDDGEVKPVSENPEGRLWNAA